MPSVVLALIVVMGTAPGGFFLWRYGRLRFGDNAPADGRLMRAAHAIVSFPFSQSKLSVRSVQGKWVKEAPPAAKGRQAL